MIFKAKLRRTACDVLYAGDIFRNITENINKHAGIIIMSGRHEVGLDMKTHTHTHVCI